MEQNLNKRKSEKLRVISAMFWALLDLLEEKSIETVKVTELIQKANVSRMSYYRNFDSKEDILRRMLFIWLDDYLKTHAYDTGFFASYNNIIFSLGFMQKYREALLRIYDCGLAVLLLEIFNEFHEVLTGDMLKNDPERYQIYLYIGGLYNVGITWLKEGMTESLEEMANIISKYFSWRKIL